MFEAHSCTHLAASDEVHCPLHVHPAPVIEDIADAAGTVDKAHVTLLTTCRKAEAVGTVAMEGEVKGSSGDRKEWEREWEGRGGEGEGTEGGRKEEGQSTKVEITMLASPVVH